MPLGASPGAPGLTPFQRLVPLSWNLVWAYAEVAAQPPPLRPLLTGGPAHPRHNQNPTDAQHALRPSWALPTGAEDIPGRHSHQNLAAPKLGSASGQESHSSWGAARRRELPRAPPPVPCRTPGTICSPQGPGDLVNASPCPSLLLWATWGCTPRRFSASTPTLALLSATLTVTGLPVTSDPDTPPLDSA